MFDYHLHTRLSFDSDAVPEEMVRAALQMGMKEICFTDHRDYDPLDPEHYLRYETQDYAQAYDHLQAEGLKIRKGFEFGILADNMEQLHLDIQQREYDFVIGSIHFAEGLDPYYEPYWKDKTIDQAEMVFLEETLECVRAHDEFDVLGHLTFLSKAWANPTKRPIRYDVYREITDEIMKELVRKGKGLEINTSGKDACGAYLPSADYLRRFKELGGEIVTVGSDAHNTQRVGQYCFEACELAREIFGHVCTFAGRQPIFHKL